MTIQLFHYGDCINNEAGLATNSNCKSECRHDILSRVMNIYELTVILPAEATAAKIKSFGASLEKLLTVSKGKVAEAKEWGKIEFTYPIKKQKSGTFLHYKLELEPSGVKNINDKFRLEGDIIRYLLVKVEN